MGWGGGGAGGGGGGGGGGRGVLVTEYAALTYTLYSIQYSCTGHRT